MLSRRALGLRCLRSAPLFLGDHMTNSFTKASYRQRVTHFTEELDFLSEEDKDWIMGRAILTRLGWA